MGSAYLPDPSRLASCLRILGVDFWTLDLTFYIHPTKGQTVRQIIPVTNVKKNGLGREDVIATILSNFFRVPLLGLPHLCSPVT